MMAKVAVTLAALAGLLAGVGASGLLWYAAYALDDMGTELHEWPEGVEPHTHTPSDSLLPVVALSLLLVPPVFAASMAANIAARRIATGVEE